MKTTAAALQHEENRAALRFRLERLRAGLRWLYLSGAALILLLIVGTVTTPSLANSAWTGSLVCLFALLLSGVVLFFCPVPWRRIHRRMDEQLNLPDSILTSAEWRASAPSAWKDIQLCQTVSALKGVNWRTAWPLRWPQFTAAAAVALIAALLCLASFQNLRRQDLALQNEIVEARKEKPSDQLKALEETIEDWELAQQTQPDPELAALLAELQPLREQMKQGMLAEKEALAEINRIQDKLAERLENSESASLSAHAVELAEAFANQDGASQFEAALRRKDFADAAAAAAARAEELNKEGASMPTGEGAEKSANRLEKGANALGEQQNQTTDAMESLAQNLRKSDSKGASKSWSSLSSCMGNECKRCNGSSGLKIQLLQLSMCKGGQCQKTGSSMPKLCLFKKISPSGGKGAGKETDPNRLGAATDLNSKTKQENLTGTAGEGASEVTTEKNDMPEPEFATAAAAAQNFKAYEKLSQEAIEDENLPLTHRQTIKSYFQVIRPGKDSKQ